MQNTTADYKIEINKPSRSFECKITIGNNIYTNEDLVNLTLEYTQPQEGFSIGGTISKSLDLTLLNRGDIIYSTSQIKVEIGLKIGSKIEYILMGTFNIDDIEKTDYTTKFTAYDNMIKFETPYFSSLGDKPTLKQVVNELSKITGVEFTGSLPAYTVNKLDGFSCREVLSYVASICGGNAIITRDGKFTIKSLNEVEKAIDGNNYFDYKREEVKYKVGQISCQVDENNILSKGSIGTDSMELGFENPWITEAILNDVYNKLNGVSYLGYSMKWQGDLSLDPYDIITVTDIKNVVRKIPILSQKISYTGGLTSEIGAKGETKNKNSFSSSGSTTNKVNRLVTEQAVIKEALIEKANIKDVEAVSIRTQTLEAKTAKIEEAIIDVAHIKDLNAINANIQNLIAADATINNALIGKADITELNAVKGTINVLESDTANIKNLLAGNISGESGQLIHLTASNVVIADAVIKDLIAANISVQDLKAGTISTNKFSIASTDGGLSIVGPTMQFKDKNNKVRIQMGQDTQGNFNFILRGADGTTTLIDHTGIKEKAIADNLIKENMVAADAIGEKQINYSSLITGLNKDTTTSLIKASKVAIDLTGQSLEVSFNSLKSNVDGIQVGGRNLVRNSNFELGKEGWNALPTIKEENGLKYVEQGYGWGVQQKIVFEPNTTYTLSLMIKNSTSDSSRFRLSTNFGNFYIGNFSSEWEYRTLTFNVGTKKEEGDIVYFLKESNGKSNVLLFGKIKIEKGNKATDYTVAPEDVDTKIESNTTSITVVQGKIEGLISENTIIKGDVTTISDKYTSLKATVDGINTTVASHTSSIGTINTNISGLSGKVTTVENNYTSLSQNLDGFKTTVANNYSTKSELSTVDGKVTSLNSRVSTAESSITQLNNKIALKVEATDVIEAINNVQIGGRNLFKGYDDKEITLNNYDNTGSFTQFINKFTFDPADYIDREFTISFYAKSPNGSTALNLYNRNGTPRYFYFDTILDANLNTEWKHYKFTFTNKDRGSSYTVSNKIEIYAPSKLGVLVKKIKVELGNKATDWTPAPEDIDANISEINSKITTTNNKVAEIITSLDSINLKVQSTEQTVTNHTTKLGQVDTKISTAKNDAISTASNDATSKANTAQTNAINSAKSYTDGQITSVNKTITDKVAEIKLTTDSITQRVSSTESRLTSTTAIANNANSKIDNLQIGGRNLILNSKAILLNGSDNGNNNCSIIENDYVKISPINNGNVYNTQVSTSTNRIQGKTYTLSFEILTSTTIGFYWYPSENYAKGSYISASSKWQKISFTYTQTGADKNTKTLFGFNGLVGGNTYYYRNLKLEEGNKITDWTPAPEDIDEDIATVETKITTTNNKIATIETNLSSITSRVSSTESKVTTINGNVTSLQSRMTTAEQKITPTAITTTISSAITGGTGSISTTQFVMDKTGLTIKNGALTIQNKAGTTVFTSDTNGNLIFTGTAKSQFGSQWVGLDAGGITFQDSQRNEQMLRAGLSYFESNRDMNGVNFALAKYGDFIRFSHIAKTDLTNGWTSSDTQYNFFDCWSGDQSVNGVAFKKGINVYAPMYVNSNGILFNNDSNFTSDIRGATWNTMTNLLGIFGDNGLSLGYRNGSAYEARIVMTEGSHPGTDDKIKSWGHWNCSGYVVHNATFRGTFQNSLANTLTRSYTETEAVMAEGKQVRVNFENIQLINGQAILNIPKAYMGINSGYIVNSIVKKGAGDVWVESEEESRFIIKGDADIKINIEIIIKINEISSLAINEEEIQIVEVNDNAMSLEN